MLNKDLFTELFEKYTSGSCTDAERESFFQIVRQHPDDPLMSLLMDGLYEKIKKGEGEQFQHTQSPVVEMRPGKVRKLVYKVTAAAVLTGVIILSVLYLSNDSGDYKSKLAGNIRRTAKAEQGFILLPDSTQIWTNASTDVRYPKEFAKDKREIYLEGEAFLDVKHAEKVPFIIHLPGKISVTVLGTAFNIKAFPDRGQAIISVKRGRVSVSKGKQVLSVLTVGQEIQVSMKNNSAAVKKVAAEQISGWQTGNLYFNDMLLSDVVKDISLQKNIEIKIEGEKLANTIIKAGFKKDETISGMLAVIKALTDCSIREENGVYTLY
jgi:transmembrane sensor